MANIEWPMRVEQILMKSNKFEEWTKISIFWKLFSGNYFHIFATIENNVMRNIFPLSFHFASVDRIDVIFWLHPVAAFWPVNKDGITLWRVRINRLLRPRTD